MRKGINKGRENRKFLAKRKERGERNTRRNSATRRKM
jgi:hypothetical protein